MTGTSHHWPSLRAFCPYQHARITPNLNIVLKALVLHYFDHHPIVEMDDEEVCNVDVHPIFRARNWNASGRIPPDAFFEAILPALQLATLWITNPAYSKYWLQVLFGRIYKDQPSGHWFINRPEPRWTHEDLLEGLNEIAGWVRLGVQEDGPETAMAIASTEKRSGIPAPPGLVRRQTRYVRPNVPELITIKFQSDVFRFAMRRIPAAPEDERKRFWTYFAAVLTHEFAHAAHTVRHHPVQGYGMEPFLTGTKLRTMPYAELGIEWEYYTIGASILPMGHAMGTQRRNALWDVSRGVIAKSYIGRLNLYAMQEQAQTMQQMVQMGMISMQQMQHYMATKQFEQLQEPMMPIRQEWFDKWFRANTWYSIAFEGRHVMRLADG